MAKKPTATVTVEQTGSPIRRCRSMIASLANVTAPFSRMSLLVVAMLNAVAPWLPTPAIIAIAIGLGAVMGSINGFFVWKIRRQAKYCRWLICGKPLNFAKNINWPFIWMVRGCLTPPSVLMCR